MKSQVLEDQPSTRGVGVEVARKANDNWLVALWSDACAYSLLSSGILFNINVPLLQLASSPAAIMAGAACLSANVGGKFVKNAFSL
jgi:hypothetical protein